MKLTPFQLAALAVGSFVAIIGLNVLAKYQGNEDFRDQLKNMTPTDLLSIRTRRIAEENMVPVAVADNTDEETDGNDES